jgi:hypothetical protein
MWSMLGNKSRRASVTDLGHTVISPLYFPVLQTGTDKHPFLPFGQVHTNHLP